MLEAYRAIEPTTYCDVEHGARDDKHDPAAVILLNLPRVRARHPRVCRPESSLGVACDKYGGKGDALEMASVELQSSGDELPVQVWEGYGHGVGWM